MQSSLVHVLISAHAVAGNMAFSQNVWVSALRHSVDVLFRIGVSAGLMLLLSLGSSAQGQTVSQGGPNFIGVELLGRAFLYSINYERYITQRFGIGVGIATWEIDNRVIGIFPLYMSVTPIG